MWEPKPHVIGFVASMLFVAAVSTAADRMAADGVGGVTVDDLAGSQSLDTGADPTDVPLVAMPSPSDSPSVAPPTNPSGGTPATAGDASTPAPADAGGDEDADGGTTPKPTTPKPTTPKPTTPKPAAPTYPDAKLYTGAAATRGITKDAITLCGHAALALGAAFDTSREDLNVYWDMVNDNGGVLGRDVNMTWEDDAYVSDKAVQAATSCADKDPFMILGGIGFDQIPGVRTWAEANDELYLHHIAVAPTKTYDYSFSLSPTVQLVGQESGNYIAKNHAKKKVGVIFRNTDNWNPGSAAGIKVMRDKKMDVTEYPIFQNQGVYQQELNKMQLAGVEVVWVWENALNAAQIINQAEELEYRPTWVVFPFQTTIDILTEPTEHTIEGVASWGSYAPGGYGGDHASFGVDAEIKRFEAAYAKYRPGTTPNDILWQVWVGNKITHRMFSDCGQDCTRNRFAGMMLSGYKVSELPGCPVDFSDSRSQGGHHGGFRFFTQKMFFPKSGPAYRTTSYCATTLR